MEERKRGSEREYRLTSGEADVAKILIQSGGRKLEDQNGEKPLRKARSEAELTRVRQGWALIVLASLNLLVALLILGYQVGII